MSECKPVPCPFCGNENVVVGGWPLEHVSCKCGAKGPDSSSRAEAILGWNRSYRNCRTVCIESVCPFSSIPATHGSIVDIDQLKSWIETWRAKVKYYHPYSKAHTIPIDELYSIFEQVDKLLPKSEDTYEESGQT